MNFSKPGESGLILRLHTAEALDSSINARVFQCDTNLNASFLCHQALICRSNTVLVVGVLWQTLQLASFSRDAVAVSSAGLFLTRGCSVAGRLVLARGAHFTLPRRSVTEFFSLSCCSPAVGEFVPPQRCRVRANVRRACCGSSPRKLFAVRRLVLDHRARHLCCRSVVPRRHEQCAAECCRRWAWYRAQHRSGERHAAEGRGVQERCWPTAHGVCTRAHAV